MQPYRPACGRRKDTHRHFVHFFSCHRIFARISGGYACRDIHLRIVGHHTLVHPIESELFPVRTPECSFGNAELVTMYGFSIHQIVCPSFVVTYRLCCRTKARLLEDGERSNAVASAGYSCSHTFFPDLKSTTVYMEVGLPPFFPFPETTVATHGCPPSGNSTL